MKKKKQLSGKTGFKKDEGEEKVVSVVVNHHFAKKSLVDDSPEQPVSNKSGNVKPERAKPDAAKDEMQKKLLEIYENTDGTMPDMKNFTKIKRSRLIGAFSTLLLSAIFLLSATLASVFVMKPDNSFSANDITLDITGESEVAFGEETAYLIEYKNTGRAALVKAELQIKYPEGFVFKESSLPAKADGNDVWELGTVEPGAGGSIIVKGLVYGGNGESQSFRVFLNYTPGNFNSEFQKVETLAVKVTRPLLNLSFIGPDEAAVGANAEFQIGLDSTSTFSNLLMVKIEPSANFSKKDSTPVADDNEPRRWTLAGLSGRKDIVVRGSFAKETEGNPSSVKVLVYGWKSDKKIGEPYLLAETTRIIRLVESGAMPLLVINGATDKLAVAPGDTLNASFSVKNTGSADIKNAKVRFVIESPAYQGKSALNWLKLEDKFDGTVVGENVGENARRGIIEWTEKQISGLKIINPEAIVAGDLSLPIKSTAETNWTNYIGNGLSAVLELEYVLDSEKKIMRSNPITMTLDSDLGLEVRDNVANDAENRETHTVTWLLTNNFHELKNVRVEADIYGDVAWLAEALTVPAGKADFDSKAKKITWTIDVLPTDVDVLGLQYSVILNGKNPSQSNLTSKARIKALDTVTGREIIKAGDEVLLGGATVAD